jgi:hypothetical protein
VITNVTLIYVEGNGGFASKPTLLKALKRTLQEMIGTDMWYGTMPKVCMTVWIMKTTDLEEVIDTEEMEVKNNSQKERKRERKRKKEQKRKERNAKLRRRTKAREITYYINEAEYYLEERERHEEQYDDEQCAYYHRSYIEEALNDIRKRLDLRSQPIRTARHSRWEKEMQLRREQKEEQATETEITIYETEQQQEQKIKDGKKRKEITKPNHAVEWIREWLTLTTQLDGTGGHGQLSNFEEGITGTTQNTQRRRHAQSLDKDSLQLPRPTLAEEQERSLNYQKEHPHPVPKPVRCSSTGIWRDQKESTWVFTYWEAGGNDSLASSIPAPLGVSKGRCEGFPGWAALVYPRGVRANLGTSDTKEEAAAAYDSGSRLHFKQNEFCNYATQMDAEEAIRLRGGARRVWGAVATSSLPAPGPAIPLPSPVLGAAVTA